MRKEVLCWPWWWDKAFLETWKMRSPACMDLVLKSTIQRWRNHRIKYLSIFKRYNKSQWRWNVMTAWKKGEKSDQRCRHQPEYVVPCRTEFKLIIFILVAVVSHWRVLRGGMCPEIYGIHSYKQQNIRNPESPAY